MSTFVVGGYNLEIRLHSEHIHRVPLQSAKRQLINGCSSSLNCIALICLPALGISAGFSHLELVLFPSSLVAQVNRLLSDAVAVYN